MRRDFQPWLLALPAPPSATAAMASPSPYLIHRRMSSHYTNPFPLATYNLPFSETRSVEGVSPSPRRPGERARSVRESRCNSSYHPRPPPPASLRSPSPTPSFIPLRPIRSSSSSFYHPDDEHDLPPPSLPPCYAPHPYAPPRSFHPHPDPDDLTQLPSSPPSALPSLPTSVAFPSSPPIDLDATPQRPTHPKHASMPAPLPLPSPPLTINESDRPSTLPRSTTVSQTSIDSANSGSTGERQRYRSQLSRSHSSVTPINAPSSDKKSISGRLQAIRKKIESELSRKRTTNFPAGGQQQQQSSSKRSSKAKKGTVAGLKPSPALTVPESMSVADASQLCAAKRSDCVLVVDDEEGLSGIFTAKDLAFRVRVHTLALAEAPSSDGI